MTIFPDLADYRIILVDDRAETTALVAAIFSAAGVELTVAGAVDAAARILTGRPDVVLVATAITGKPFAVVEAAQRNGVPVLALDLGSAGPEISDRLRRDYGVAVLRTVDDPEGLCHAAKRTADKAGAKVNERL